MDGWGQTGVRPGSDPRLTPATLAGRVFVASLVFIGLLHVIFGESLTRMLPVWPDGLPGRPYWAHMAGVLLAAAGALVLAREHARGPALGLAAVLLLPVILMQLPRALSSGRFSTEWLNVLKWLALAAGPLVLAARRPPRDALAWQNRAVAAGAAMAPWLLGLFMLHSADLHVRHAPFVAQLMQPWMPWRTFWVYFAAVALAAGGIGLVVPRTARLAALLTSLMIFSWFLIVHTPRMLIDPAGPVGWSEMGESLAFSCFAFLLAARSVLPSMNTVRTEGAEAPASQGARRENTGST